MAETVGSLRVELSANVAAFDAGMKKAGAILGRWTEQQQRSSMAMSSAHDQALKMNAALGQTTKVTASAFEKLAKMAVTLYAVKQAVGFVTDSLKAQAEQEAAINKLNLALANQGIYSEATSKSLIAYSGALQDVSTYSDEVILDGMALLASFGLNEEQIKAATKAAMDYAAFTGKDLTTAMTTVGKAFAGNTKELSKLGLVINKTGTDSERLEQVTSQLEDRFGGAALAATQTYTGAMEQLKNQFGEVQEGLGKFLGELTGSEAPFSVAINACKSLAQFLGQDLVVALSEFRALWLETMADLVDPKLQTFMDGFKRGLTGMFAPQQSAEAAKAYRAAAVAIREHGDAAAIAAGKIAPLVNGIKTVKPVSDAAAAALKRAAEAAEKSAEKMREFWKEFAHENAMRALKSTEEAFSESERQANAWSQGVADAFLETDKAAKEFAESVREALEALSNKAAWDAVKAAEEGLAASANEAGKLADALAEVGSILNDLGISAESVLGELVAGLSAAAEGAANLMAGFASGNPAQIIAGLAGIGKAVKGLVDSESGLNRFIGGMLLLGPVGGILANVFGGPAFTAAQRLNHELMIMRTEFINASGGLVVLEEKAARAGVSLDAMWNARTVAEYEAAVNRVQAAIELTDEAIMLTEQAMARFGLTIGDMGPQFAQARLQESYADLFRAIRLAEAGGADLTRILQGGAEEINTLVQQSMQAGVALPEFMRPYIEKLIEMELLVDANGDKITDVSQIPFTETLEAGVSRLIERIEDLVDALLGIHPIEIGVSYKVNGPVPAGVRGGNDEGGVFGGGGGGGEMQQFARGGPIRRDREWEVPGTGGGQLIIGHPGEFVIPEGDVSGVLAALVGGGGQDSVATEIAALTQAIRQQGPPVAVNVSVPVDASTVPAAHQQQFIDSTADAVGASFLPGGRNFRTILRAVRAANAQTGG